MLYPCVCLNLYEEGEHTNVCAACKYMLAGSVSGPLAGPNLCLLWVTLCTSSVLAAGNRGQKSCHWKVKQ